MDASLAADPLSVPNTRDRLRTVPCNGAWDAFKLSWREIFVEAGRERKARISHELDEILRRLRVTKSEQMTALMRDYQSLLRVRYERLLRQTSSTACRAAVLSRPLSNPAALRHIKAGTVEEIGPAHVPHVLLPDGSNSSRPEEIRAVFATYFSGLFRAAEERQPTQEFEEKVRDFCGELPQLPEELANALTAPVTGEELWEAIGGMNGQTADGQGQTAYP